MLDLLDAMAIVVYTIGIVNQQGVIEMKTAKEVAQTVKCQFDKGYPVGKAQQIILDALNIKNAQNHNHAQDIFDAIGIEVSSKRQGRKSVPVVSITSVGGGFNAYGEGEAAYTPSRDIDLSAIAQYIQ